MTSGRPEDSKLIDLGERLNLVEKFITITTTKVSVRVKCERAIPATTGEPAGSSFRLFLFIGVLACGSLNQSQAW